MSDETTKTCTKCGSEKPTEDFPKNRAGVAGRYSLCRECKNSGARARTVSGDTRRTREIRWATDPHRELAERMRRAAVANSKRRGHGPPEFTAKQLAGYLRTHPVCPATGKRFDLSFEGNRWFRPSLDRIDGDKGYVKGNLVVVCFDVNNLRSHRSPKEVASLVAGSNIATYYANIATAERFI